jgi:surface polysaccharide O-acyltransferase-like enzyme
MELCVAMLLFSLRKIQKSRKPFLKRLSKICLYVYLKEKRYPFILTFLKSVSHFLKKLISTKEKVFLHHKKKVFSGKKSYQTKRKEMLFYTPVATLPFSL